MRAGTSPSTAPASGDVVRADPVPRHTGAATDGTSNGRDDHRLVTREPGVSARFERFSEDWNPNRGGFDAVEMPSIIDADACTGASIPGDVRAIDRLDLETVGLMGHHPSLTVHPVDGTRHYTCAMSTDTDPHTDGNDRPALEYAIDRRNSWTSSCSSTAASATTTPSAGTGASTTRSSGRPRAIPTACASTCARPGSTGRGWRSRPPTRRRPAPWRGRSARDSAAPAGITFDVARKPNDGWWSDVWMRGPFPAVCRGGRPTQDGALTIAHAAGAPWNGTFRDDARSNERRVAARAGLDSETRRGVCCEMQESSSTMTAAASCPCSPAPTSPPAPTS